MGVRHSSLIPLSHDHHHGLALALRCRKQALGQIRPMGPQGLKERAEEASQFYAGSLVAHFRAEEEVLFPFMSAAIRESRSIIDQLLQEHRRIRDAVSRLEAGSDVAKILFDLGDLLERHIRKEERELFPLFEEHVSDTDAEAVGRKIQRALAPQQSLE